MHSRLPWLAAAALASSVVLLPSTVAAASSHLEPLPAGASLPSRVPAKTTGAAAAPQQEGSGWSTPYTIDPQGGGLTSISCAGSAFCMAIDGDGYAISWNGTSWSAPTLVASGSTVITSPYSGAAPCDPNSTGFCSVSCPSPAFCVAVGGQDAYSFNGTNWSAPVTIDPTSQQPNQSNGVLSGVSCPSTDRCVAVDNEEDTMIFNGSTWSGPSLPPTDTSGGPQPWFQGISCPTASFCVAVGDNYEDTWTLSAGWAVPQQVIVAGQGLDIMSVSCPSTGFCAAVDDNGDAITWDPTSQLENPSAYNGVSVSDIDPGGNGFAGVSCPSTSFCVAVDHYGQAFTWNGSSWSSPTVIDGHLVNLTSISCPTTTLCIATSDSGDVVEWSSPASGQSPTITSLSPSSGPVSGGTQVTVDGSGFVSGATSVSFGPTAAPQVSVVSPEELIVTAPAAPAGTATPDRIDVTVTTSAGTSSISPSDGFLYVSPGLYDPLAPYRICDTRPGNPSGLAGPDAQCTGKALLAGAPLKVQVAGTYPCWTTASCATGTSSGVPSSGVEAAVLNVTITSPTDASYITVYPDGVGQPMASSLNFVPGQSVANLVQVAVGQSGAIDISLAQGSAEVIVDVEGYYSESSTSVAGMYFPLSSPQRICDTRPGNPSSLSGPAAQCNGKTW
ncbi:MAG: IPT/TIG domain-containing protein [Actinobacteria bacterium]|nr:IPT/TIG domain-containing protein [Actinomycetota bacterium]